MATNMNMCAPRNIYAGDLFVIIAAFSFFTGFGSMPWLIIVIQSIPMEVKTSIYWFLLGLKHMFCLGTLSPLVYYDYLPFLLSPHFPSSSIADEINPETCWYTRLNRTKFHRRLLVQHKTRAVFRNLIGFVFFLPPFLMLRSKSAFSFVAILFIFIEALELDLIFRRWKVYHAFFNCTCVFAVSTSCRVYGSHHGLTAATFYVSLGMIFLRGVLLHFDKNMVAKSDPELIPDTACMCVQRFIARMCPDAMNLNNEEEGTAV